MKIKLIDLIDKLEQDFGYSDLKIETEQAFMLRGLLDDTIQAIEVIRCCVETDSRNEQYIEADTIERKEAFNNEVSSLVCGNCDGKGTVFNGMWSEDCRKCTNTNQ